MSLLGMAFVALSSQAQAAVTYSFGPDASITFVNFNLSSVPLGAQSSVQSITPSLGLYDISFKSSVFSATAPAGGVGYGIFSASADPVSGSNGWLTLTADDGLVIKSVTQTITGIYSGGVRAGAGNTALAAVDMSTTWSSSGSVLPTPTSTGGIAMSLDGATGPAVDEGSFSFSTTTSFNNSNSVSMISALVNGGVMVEGAQSYGSLSLARYTLTITTAEATAVPEPENIALILGGLAVVGFSLSRRAKAN
jgi:hypothetical protein